VAIIGGGVTGCSCALTLAEAGLSVRVYDQREVGGGATGRNGGLGLRGTALSYPVTKRKLGESRAKELMVATEDGLARLKFLAGDAFSQVGSVRYVIDEKEFPDLEAEYTELEADGFAVRWLENGDPLFFPPFRGAFVHINDGAIEPKRWIVKLADVAANAGVEFYQGVRVSSLSELGSVKTVVVATDGYTRGLVPALDGTVHPVRSQVVATVPLTERIFPMPYYGRYGFDYWQQTDDGCLVIGGRRDKAKGDEFTFDDSISSDVQNEIEILIQELLGSLPEITHRWSGIFGKTQDSLPVVGQFPDANGLWVSCGYAGHGNVLGLICGEAVAHGILGRENELLSYFDPKRLL
jgi:glycine/D-amino acid oxidase-like deaminating enzyme